MDIKIDALNDLRNLETSIVATKNAGAEAQVAISYTVSEVHTISYFANMCKIIEDFGADSICIKDMAGILTPFEAYELVRQIRKVTSIPLEIHTHEITGMGSLTYLKSIEAGADIIDTAISPFSGGTSQPATETLYMVVKEMGYDTDLNIEVLEEIASYFEGIKNKYINNGILPVKMLSIDPKGLIYQIKLLQKRKT